MSAGPRGPAPKPNRVKRLHGEKPSRMNVHELELPAGPVTAPPWLTDASAAEYERLACELRPVLAEPDSTLLAILAEAITDMLRWRELVRMSPLLKADDGLLRRNPAQIALQGTVNQIIVLTAQLGMSPAARARILNGVLADEDTGKSPDRLLSG
jgi:P27 family predicted phage terminase small subunit